MGVGAAGVHGLPCHGVGWARAAAQGVLFGLVASRPASAPMVLALSIIIPSARQPPLGLRSGCDVTTIC